jgi:hypothetical protein
MSKDTQSKADATTFRASYPVGVWPNSQIEVKATEDGLEFDEDFTIPWDWILKAAESQRAALQP